jgi:hypothetical protein
MPAVKARKFALASVAATIVGAALAASKAWAAAAKEAWRVDDELPGDEDIPPSERPFLPLLTGERDEEQTTNRADDAP